MRTKQYFSVFLVSITIALFFSFLFSASAAASPAVSPTITETRITTNPSNSEFPAIYGNTIVWQDDRNGNWDIYILDLSIKKETHTTNKSDQINPDIDGGKVVWEDLRNGGHDIYLQDLATKKQTRITTSGKAIKPRIQGNRIVWMDGRNGGYLDGDIWPARNWDIYMYDIAASKEYQITSNQSMQADPDIYKDRIVWRDQRNMGENPYERVQVYMYNISTSTESPVNYGENLVHFVNGAPRIYGNRIVWMAESIGTNYNIYVYDLSTSTLTMINYTSGYDSHPAIYGDRVVWTDGVDPGNGDIKMYDLSTSTGTQITTNKSQQELPAIYGDKIVWQDSRNWKQDDMYNYDIYMATLSYLPVVSFSASPVSGKAPLKVQFNDKSTGVSTSWKWSFGDKTYSTQKNPKHTYSKAGKYIVSLTVKNGAGANTKTISNYIIVS